MRYLVPSIVVFSIVLATLAILEMRNGREKQATEMRASSAFRGIEVRGDSTSLMFFCPNRIKIDVRDSELASIEITAVENLLPSIKTEVRSEVLRISVDKSATRDTDIKILAMTPRLGNYDPQTGQYSDSTSFLTEGCTTMNRVIALPTPSKEILRGQAGF